MPDDCPIAGHGTESFLDAIKARNLQRKKQVQFTCDMSTSFSETTLGYLHPYHSCFLPKIRCIKTRLNTFQRRFKELALEKSF